MLILSQDKTMLLNLDHITRIKSTGGEILAVDTNRVTNILGEYSSGDAAEKVLQEIIAEYSKFFRCDGGPLATMDAYVQPMMFEAPKIYKMPAYR